MDSTWMAQRPPDTPGMLTISQSVISGGTFTQHNQDNRHIQIHDTKTGFDRLQEAVTPGAFHNSGERFDPPRCHPNTRVAVMNKIMDWILSRDPETRSALILWLYGAAGAGKSAIAQTITELCYTEGILAASFFFGRSDSSRNHAGHLFTTIAYQMALTLLPQFRQKLVATVEYDPLIFTRSLPTQFLHLIVQPLRNISIPLFNDPRYPCLILINGLDECTDRKTQRDILDIVLNSVHQYSLPLMFLIASRPEHDIATKFASPVMSSSVARLILDNFFHPDADIEVFLCEKLRTIKETHPFKELIPAHWPEDDVIWKLVYKSSGQFIYASTVVKYLESIRHRPDHRLEVILNIRTTRGELPFAELDALYTQILSSVDEIEQVLDILGFVICNWWSGSVDEVEGILSLVPGTIQMLCCDLGSIISFTHVSPSFIRINILHASLSDFLLDQSRSSQFYINIASKCTKHVQTCFRLLSGIPLPTDNHVFLTATEFISHNFSQCTHTQLRDDILGFSLSHIYNHIDSLDKDQYPNSRAMIPTLNVFVPNFLSSLKNSNFDDAENLYNHHLSSFEEVLRRCLEPYYKDMRLTLLIALVDFVRVNRCPQPPFLAIYEFHKDFQLFHVDEALSDTDCHLCSLINTYGNEVIQIISTLLKIPVRSGGVALDGNKYVNATLCCLIYLCNHTSLSNILLRRHTKRAKEIRRNTPWMWLRRSGQDGTLDKPWIWHKKQGDCAYRRKKDDDYIESFNMNNPVIYQRVWSDKYRFGLEYISYFLPLSGRSEELIERASRYTFASRLQEFPKHAKKARKAIAMYLERMARKSVGIRGQD